MNPLGNIIVRNEGQFGPKWWTTIAMQWDFWIKKGQLMASRNTEINRHTLQNAHPGESIGHGSAGIWRGQKQSDLSSVRSRQLGLLPGTPARPHGDEKKWNDIYQGTK